MWTRFTERARRVVFFAQEEAQNREQWNVSALHLMLGILREDGSPSVAQRVLMSLGQDRANLYRQVADWVSAVREIPVAEMQLAPDARRAIDWSYEEARLLKNHYLGTEHLLLGIFAVQEAIAALLPPGGIDRARAAVRELQEPGSESSPLSRQTGLADCLEALSPEDRARLSGDGLPLNALPPGIQDAILRHFGCSSLVTNSDVILGDCMLHLREETDADGKRYQLSIRLSAQTTIPVRQSTGG